MAFRVTYTEKNGSRGSAIFPSRTVAEIYARGVKSPEITEVDMIAKAVEIKHCPEGTADAQREASRAYFAAVSDGQKYITPTEQTKRAEERAYEASEHEAEICMERYGAARLNGACENEALDYANGY